MADRFLEHHQSIEMLRKLADRLGITALNEFNDVVPLFFSHTAFKSYPAALVDKKRFDLMTKWLDKLTSYDLSGVDATGCTGIDDWIDRLDEQTPTLSEDLLVERVSPGIRACAWGGILAEFPPWMHGQMH